MSCLPAGSNKANNACGAGGGVCVDCSANGQICDPSTLTCTSWQSVYTQFNHDELWAAWAVGPGDAWFAGYQRLAVVHVSAGQPLDGYLSGTGALGMYVSTEVPHTVYVAGSWGTQGIARTFPEPWDGGGSPGTRELLTDARAFYTVFPAGPDVYLAGEASGTRGNPRVYLRDAGGWTPATPSGMTGSVQDGFGVGPGEYYVVTTGTSTSTLGHVTGAAYASTPLTGTAFSLWGTPQGTLWLAGDNYFARVGSDGGVTPIDAGAGGRWWSVWAADDSAVFLAGRDNQCPGSLLRFDGTSFKRSCLSASTLLAVHGTSATDVWASDADGGIWHYGP